MRAVIFLVIILPINAWAGAWLQKEDTGRQVIANFNYYRASSAFDAQGLKYKMPTYKKYEFSPYAEYGLFENLTVGGSFAAKIVNNEARGKNSYGVDDIKIFTRSYLYQGSLLGFEGVVFSIEPALYFPLKNGGEINSQNGVAPSLKFNGGYSNADYYVDATLGYEFWQSHADKLLAESSFGYYLTDDITWLSQSFSSFALGANYLDGADYDLSKAQTSLVWQSSDEISHQVGVSYDIAGRNTGAGIGILYSMWYKF